VFVLSLLWFSCLCVRCGLTPGSLVRVVPPWLVCVPAFQAKSRRRPASRTTRGYPLRIAASLLVPPDSPWWVCTSKPVVHPPQAVAGTPLLLVVAVPVPVTPPSPPLSLGLRPLHPHVCCPNYTPSCSSATTTRNGLWWTLLMTLSSPARMPPCLHVRGWCRGPGCLTSLSGVSTCVHPGHLPVDAGCVSCACARSQTTPPQTSDKPSSQRAWACTSSVASSCVASYRRAVVASPCPAVRTLALRDEYVPCASHPPPCTLRPRAPADTESTLCSPSPGRGPTLSSTQRACIL
jgi:hypothetical protein